MRDRCVRNRPPDGSPEQDPLVIGLRCSVQWLPKGMHLLPPANPTMLPQTCGLTYGNGAISRDNVRNGSAEGPVNKWQDGNRLHGNACWHMTIHGDTWKAGPSATFREHSGRGYWAGEAWRD